MDETRSQAALPTRGHAILDAAQDTPQDTPQDMMARHGETASADETPHTIELVIPARAEYVRVARLVTVGVANRLGFSYDEIEDLKLAVAEACNNAILHADAPAAEKLVRVRHTVYPDRLEIAVSDEGHATQIALPEATPREPHDSTTDLPEGGLGLLLIRSLMDEVTQDATAPPHTLRMVKRLSQPR